MSKPLIADAWTLAVIGCEKEGVTLDKCLIFIPPGGDINETIQIAQDAGIPQPYLQNAIVLGPDFDAADSDVDEMHPYVG